jgi:hypothetical protein
MLSGLSVNVRYFVCLEPTVATQEGQFGGNPASSSFAESPAQASSKPELEDGVPEFRAGPES